MFTRERIKIGSGANLFFPVFFGLIFLVVFAFVISNFFVSRPIQNKQLAQPPNPSSPFSISQMNNDQVEPTAVNELNLNNGSQIYSDNQLGYSIQYPKNWYDNDESGSFEGRCFSATPEGLRNEPRFCVNFKPFVRLPDLRGVFVAPEKQQQFFSLLENDQVGYVTIIGTKQYIVTQHLQLEGAPAIERIETNTIEAEGVEPAYTVVVYVNTPQKGLIRLSMHTLNKEQFEQNENELRQILESFSLLE